MRLLFGFLLVSLGVGCSTIPTLSSGINEQTAQLDVNQFYKRDLVIEINKQKFDGVVVLERQPRYEFKITAPGDADIVTITSCNREDILRKQDDVFKYVYEPTEVEMQTCPIAINSYGTKFRYAGAYVDIQDGTMGSEIICNGKTLRSFERGVGVCQTRAGLKSTIKFQSEMDVATPTVGCSPMETSDGKRFEVIHSKGVCSYRFREKSGARLWFRMVIIGYSEFNYYR